MVPLGAITHTAADNTAGYIISKTSRESEERGEMVVITEVMYIEMDI